MPIPIPDFIKNETDDKYLSHHAQSRETMRDGKSGRLRRCPTDSHRSTLIKYKLWGKEGARAPPVRNDTPSSSTSARGGRVHRRRRVRAARSASVTSHRSGRGVPSRPSTGILPPIHTSTCAHGIGDGPSVGPASGWLRGPRRRKEVGGGVGGDRWLQATPGSGNDRTE